MSINPAEKKTAYSKGFFESEDLEKAFTEAEDLWVDVGRTNKYSTGLLILDDYMGGGYGSDKSGELILIHSTSKTYKSTFAWQLLKTPLEQGCRVGVMILEGRFPESLVTLKQLYSYEGYDRFEKTKERILKDNLIVAASRKFLNSDFELNEVVDWMSTQRAQGVELFMIDPIGYISDYARAEGGMRSFQMESRLMKQLSNFVYDTKSTVICIQHNVKDGDYLNPAHRQSAIGGSQSFSKSPTKVIELRNEGLIDDDYPNKGKLISAEMYMARSVRDWRGAPVLIQACSHEDKKGRFFFMPRYDEGEADAILNKSKAKENRRLWYGQLKGDLEELKGE